MFLICYCLCAQAALIFQLKELVIKRYRSIYRPNYILEFLVYVYIYIKKKQQKKNKKPNNEGKFSSSGEDAR